jgi:hypothetical protein
VSSDVVRTARHLYKLFSVKGLKLVYLRRNGTGLVSETNETIRNNLIGVRNKLISSLNSKFIFKPDLGRCFPRDIHKSPSVIYVQHEGMGRDVGGCVSGVQVAVGRSAGFGVSV